MVKLVGSKRRPSRVVSWCRLQVVKNTATSKLGSVESNLVILGGTRFRRLYVGFKLVWLQSCIHCYWLMKFDVEPKKKNIYKKC